jgi:hypothetical protein
MRMTEKKVTVTMMIIVTWMTSTDSYHHMLVLQAVATRGDSDDESGDFGEEHWMDIDPAITELKYLLLP